MASNVSKDIIDESSGDITIPAVQARQFSLGQTIKDDHLRQANDHYGQTFTDLNNIFAQPILDKQNQQSVTLHYQKVCDHLNSWKMYLENYILNNGLDQHVAKLHLTQVMDKLKSCDMIYRQYLDFCVKEADISYISKRSISHSSKSKSSSSSYRRLEKSRMLKLEALQERELAAQKQRLAEMKAKFKEQQAQLLDELASDRDSSNSVLDVDTVISARDVTFRRSTEAHTSAYFSTFCSSFPQAEPNTITTVSSLPPGPVYTNSSQQITSVLPPLTRPVGPYFPHPTISNALCTNTATIPSFIPPYMSSSQLPHPTVMRQPSLPSPNVIHHQAASKDDLYLLGRNIQQEFRLPALDKVEFAGDPLEYHAFIRSFYNTIGRLTSDPSTLLAQLFAHCKGEAYEVIKHLRMADDPAQAFHAAKDTLEFHFGNRSLIISTFIKQLTEGPKIRVNDVKGLCKLSSQMRNCSIVFDNWNAGNLLDAPAYLVAIFERLPPNMRTDYVMNGTWTSFTIPSFNHLLKFIESRARLYNTFYGRTLAELATKSSGHKGYINKRPSKFSTFTTLSTPKSEPNFKQNYNKTNNSGKNGKSALFCYLCKGDHILMRCNKFKEKSISNRRQFVKDQSICFNCMSSKKHFSSSCPSEKRCLKEGCGGLHHTLLHLEQVAKQPALHQSRSKEPLHAPQTETTSVNSMSVLNTLCPVRLMAVAVEIHLPDASDKKKTIAFLDLGSQRSFCSTRLAKSIGLSGKPERCMIRTTNGVVVHTGEGVSFRLNGVNNTNIVEVHNALTFDKIPDVRDSLPKPDIIDKYPHLDGLKFPDIDGDVELLIGADTLGNCPFTDSRVGPPGTPGALLTCLGWCLFGKDPSMKSDNNSLNYINTSVPMISDLQNLQSDVAVNFISTTLPLLSFNDTSCDTCMSPQSLPEEDHNLQEEEIACDNSQTPTIDNHELYCKIITKPEVTDSKDAEFATKYIEKLDEYIKNGYAEQIPEDELAPTERTWFIPHHATRQSKFCVVFDSSAEFDGKSLNKNLLSGPDFNNSLVGVLLRFRLNPIAVSCDIRQMFHRILVKREDTQSLRFLWFPTHDLTKPVYQFRMLSHAFGTTCSPSIATFALRKVAEDNLSNADPTAVRCICFNFYVDDGLFSKDTVEETSTLVRQTTDLLATGGFHLTKFLSNEPEVLQCVPEEDKAPVAHALELGDDAVSRTLGLNWNAATDQFVVIVRIQERPSTRRGILSMVSQIFDPLGCNRPKGFTPSTFQLHVFCDASSFAYGTCAYLKIIDDAGNIHTAFVKGSSRVAPKKVVTIPRLELTAAVAATELELNEVITDVFFYTDSMTVLRMINSRSERFKTFVANRLNTIHLLSQPRQWHHVDTKSNPADIASRGLMPDKRHKADCWFKGPSFLRSKEPLRNSHISETIEDSEICSEVKVNYNEISYKDKNSIIQQPGLMVLLKRYSKFERLISSVIWLQRFKTYMIGKLLHRSDSPVTGCFTVAERENATIDIVKLIQADSLSAEFCYFKDMMSSGPPPSDRKRLKSPFAKELLQCNPYVADGILRVGGRLRQSELQPDQRNPVILPPYHHATKLLIDYYHCEHGHCGSNQVQAYLLQKYWILHLQSAVAKVLRECMPCKIRSARPGKQWMSDMPAVRLCTGNRPFFHSFVDYFGHIKVKLGRSEHKRYGVIVTCLSTRAIHLEVA
ncbi:uncharacterized protein LOC144427239 [Styela clava]